MSPDVKISAVDGKKPATIRDAWRVADIFMSLADNIQETFGLTPLEAMAAGLPVVVSDWNGYRETVRHAVDGFRVPTYLPPAGAGQHLAALYGCGRISYDDYVGSTALCSAVDIDVCATHLTQLIEEPRLRREMGAAGRQRARESYDWRTVIGQYQQLWTELAARRRCAPKPTRPFNCRHPGRQDPFQVYRSYASHVVTEGTSMRLWTENPRQLFEQISSHSIDLPIHRTLADADEIISLLNQLKRGPILVGDFLATRPVNQHAPWYRTITWMAKVGLIRLESFEST
jgi:hypothetical protein